MNSKLHTFITQAKEKLTPLFDKVKKIPHPKTNLNSIEEKAAFPFSRIFWHIILLLSVLTLTFGALILITTLTPTLKKGVKEQPIPAFSGVTATELTQCGGNTTEEYEEHEPSEGIYESAPNMYASFAKLEEAIPPKKYSWKAKGYTTQEWTGWNYTNKWVTTHPGITRSLKKLLTATYGNDTTAQAKTVEQLAKTVSAFPVKYRKELLLPILDWANKKSNDLATVESVLADLTPVLAQDSTSKALRKIVVFMTKNPSDGFEWGRAVAKVYRQNSAKAFSRLYPVMTQQYLHTYGENIQIFAEATDSLVALEPKVRGANQTRCYYELYASKTAQYYIDKEKAHQEFLEKQAEAEVQYELKKAEKKAKRLSSLLYIGVAVGAIAFFSLMLVLLSIQRTLVTLASQGKEETK